MDAVHYIGGSWVPGRGPELSSEDPASGETLWQGAAADSRDVDAAVRAARRASENWAALSLEARVERIERFGQALADQSDAFARVLCRDAGKPLWESRTEIEAMAGKIGSSIRAIRERRSPRCTQAGTTTLATRYKPHGVLAVLGPFNLPGHLPNAHIVPALLAGNAVVFKPSEKTPLAGEELARIWERAGLPAGVFNMVQGGRATGGLLAAHSGIDGLLFTGSFAAGQALSRLVAQTPGRMLALEMGGNNPLAVWAPDDPGAAAYATILSAFITSGQRCSCARRLIVADDAAGDRFLERLLDMTQSVRVGPWQDDPEPFMGPVITPEAAFDLLAAQDRLLRQGGRPLLPMRLLRKKGGLLAPGILDVTEARERPDEEIFGPLLQVVRVRDFDALIEEANHTAYGLTAGLLSERRELYDAFCRRVRAGVLSWNRPTTGPSGSLPFGGVGRSGNHRPSGYFAADYCSYPVASVEVDALEAPVRPVPGIAL
ncbi:MAG: succinylglutamate-semialdehyde dehydrogenase [bacterium]